MPSIAAAISPAHEKGSKATASAAIGEINAPNAALQLNAGSGAANERKERNRVVQPSTRHASQNSAVKSS